MLPCDIHAALPACGSERSCIRPCCSHPWMTRSPAARRSPSRAASGSAVVVPSSSSSRALLPGRILPPSCSFRAVGTGQGFAIDRASACPRVPFAYRRPSMMIGAIGDGERMVFDLELLARKGAAASVHATARASRLAPKRFRNSSAAATSAPARCRTGSFGSSSEIFFSPR